MAAPNLEVNDIVLFKLTESKMFNYWRIGKIDSPPKVGRDGKVCEVRLAINFAKSPAKFWMRSLL